MQGLERGECIKLADGVLSCLLSCECVVARRGALVVDVCFLGNTLLIHMCGLKWAGRGLGERRNPNA